MTLIYDLGLQCPASYGHELLTCKSSGSRSVGSEDGVETNGQTEVIALSPLLMQSVMMQWKEHRNQDVYQLNSVIYRYIAPFCKHR